MKLLSLATVLPFLERACIWYTPAALFYRFVGQSSFFGAGLRFEPNLITFLQSASTVPLIANGATCFIV